MLSIARSSITRVFSYVSLSMLTAQFAIADVAPIDKDIYLAKLDPVFSLSLTELVNLNVFTVSKQDEPLLDAPSVVTVVNQAEIKRRGYHSLSEIVERTTGFYNGTNVNFANIASRGISTGNDQYLMLIDGHSINSVNNFGAFYTHMLPIISQYQQIEIIRGPGSTLWGADASMGIINLIPLKGKDIQGLQVKANYSISGDAIHGVQVNVDHSISNEQQFANILYGQTFGDAIDVMASYTIFEADGYGHDSLAEPGYSNYFVRGNSTVNDKAANRQDWDDSFEFYTKVSLGDFSVSARHLEFTGINPNASNYVDKLKTHDWNNTFVEFAHSAELITDTTLTSKLFYDTIYQERFRREPNPRNDYYTEYNYGLDFSASTELNETQKILYGLRYVKAKTGPNRRYTVNSDTEILFANEGFDESLGVYGEYQGQLSDNVRLIAGLRYDSNDFREDTEELFPRLAVIQKINSEWTMKYMYNSGYRRPSVGQGQRTTVTNAETGQRTDSYDVQAMYQKDDFSLDIVLFYLSMQDYMAFINSATLGNGWKNVADLTSRGVEITASKRFADKFVLYGDYAYTEAGVDDYSQFDQQTLNISDVSDDRLDGSISHIVDLGLDAQITEQLIFNINGRFVQGEQTRLDTDHFDLNSSETLDMNLRYSTDNDGVELSVYVKNILDKEAKRAFNIAQGGYYYEKGRSVGVNVAYKFGM